MNQFGASTWTPARVDTMSKLWAEGLSASQIAKALGGTTRNAVIGKVFRMGLPGRKTPSGSGIEAKIRRARHCQGAIVKVPRFNKIKAPPLESDLREAAALKPIDPTITIMQLNAFTCRYPIGDPQDADFSYCGRTCSLAGPYCADHVRLCYVPVKKRTHDATVRLANWLDKRTFKVAA